MKIKMTDGTELSVKRLNRSIGNSDQVAESLMITFGKSVTLDDVTKAITEKTVGDFTVVHRGKAVACLFQDTEYKGYSIQNFTEDTNDDETTVNAFLVKFVEAKVEE